MGQTSGTATLSFDPSGDGLAEGDETVILTGSVSGLTSGHGDADDHRRRPGADGDNTFAQPSCRG